MPLFISTPLNDELEMDVNFPFYPVVIEDRELLVDLVLLEVIDFDVILGMDWLAQWYALFDSGREIMIFRIPNDEEFWFRGNGSLMPQNLISALTDSKMLRRGYQGYLDIDWDVKADKE